MTLTTEFHNRDVYKELCNTAELVLATCADYYIAAKYNDGSKIELIPSSLRKSVQELNNYDSDIELNALQRWIRKSSIRKEKESMLNAINNTFNSGAVKIITGDSIEFNENSYNAIIMRNNSSKVKPLTKNQTIIPIYDDTDIRTVLNSITGLRFLQDLFDTNDTSEELHTTLTKIFEPQISHITISVPPAYRSSKGNPNTVYFEGTYSQETNKFALRINCRYDMNSSRAYCAEYKEK